jgi:putative hydrolase of the HAD superfamily
MTVEAVTIDAYGTLVTLHDPVGALQKALAAAGHERDAGTVRAAFQAEVEHYLPRSHLGADPASLAELRRQCAQVFLDAAHVSADGAAFAPAFIAALRFEAVDGAREACLALRAHGLRLAVVSNWDIALHDYLAELRLTELADAVVASADVGTPKPDPAIFVEALERLGVPAERAVHVGDEQDDADGARAAGLAFEPAPLAEAASRILG